MNNILSERSGVQYNMDLVYEIFDDMDKTYNFSLGPVLLSLASKSQLEELANKDYPFLRSYKHCLLNPECSILANATKESTGDYWFLALAAVTV